MHSSVLHPSIIYASIHLFIPHPSTHYSIHHLSTHHLSCIEYPSNICSSSIPSYLLTINKPIVNSSTYSSSIPLSFTIYPSFTLSLNIYYLLATSIIIHASDNYITTGNSSNHFITRLYLLIQSSIHLCFIFCITCQLICTRDRDYISRNLSSRGSVSSSDSDSGMIVEWLYHGKDTGDEGRTHSGGGSWTGSWRMSRSSVSSCGGKNWVLNLGGSVG